MEGSAWKLCLFDPAGSGERREPLEGFSPVMPSLPFSGNSAAAESDSISSSASFTNCYVQDDSLPFAKPHALHDSCALPISVGLRILAAENRRGGIFVE